MSFNNSTENLSRGNLHSYIAYATCGAVIGGCNLIILLSIAKYEALRTCKTYVLIMTLSLADATNMLAFVTAGIRRSMLIYSGDHDKFLTSWQCALVPHNIIWSFSFLLANAMLGATSIDRLLSVLWPLEYIGWSRKYTLSLAGIVYLYSIGSGMIGIAWSYSTRDWTPDIPARCIAHRTMGAFNEYYGFHYNQAPMIWALFSIFIYIIVWIVYKKRNNQMPPGTQSQQQQIDHERKFTKSLAISCLCTFCLFVIPYQLGVLSSKYSKFEPLPIIFWTMSNLNPLANVIIYPKRHREIRQAVIGLFTCKTMPIDVKMWKINTQAPAGVQMVHSRIVGMGNAVINANDVVIEEVDL